MWDEGDTSSASGSARRAFESVDVRICCSSDIDRVAKQARVAARAYSSMLECGQNIVVNQQLSLLEMLERPTIEALAKPDYVFKTDDALCKFQAAHARPRERGLAI